MGATAGFKGLCKEINSASGTPKKCAPSAQVAEIYVRTDITVKTKAETETEIDIEWYEIMMIGIGFFFVGLAIAGAAYSGIALATLVIGFAFILSMVTVWQLTGLFYDV